MTGVYLEIPPAAPDAGLLLPDVPFNGENAMLPALVEWLVRSGRIGARTRIAYEVPWLGRRIDLALVAGSGQITAFELKMGSFSRVLEQAVYNSSAFHRSWIVTGNQPRGVGLDLAAELGLGVLVIRGGNVSVGILPSVRRPDPGLVERVRDRIRQRALGGAR